MTSTVKVKVPKWAKRLGYTPESFAAWQEGIRKQCDRDNKLAEKAQERYAKLPIHKKDWRYEMDLRVRARKALSRLGVGTVGEVANLTEQSFAHLRNCGPASVSEIRQELHRLGLDFKSE